MCVEAKAVNQNIAAGALLQAFMVWSGNIGLHWHITSDVVAIERNDVRICPALRAPSSKCRPSKHSYFSSWKHHTLEKSLLRGEHSSQAVFLALHRHLGPVSLRHGPRHGDSSRGVLRFQFGKKNTR